MTSGAHQGDLEVLIVAQPDDRHAEAVEECLGAAGVAYLRTSLDVWSSQRVEWVADGTLRLTDNNFTWSIHPGTSVWWRRPGRFENPSLSIRELELARDEAALILPGALDAAGVRWIDQPWTMARARNRLVQLKLAHSLGIRFPETVVTNSVQAAAEFATSGDAVAKTISSGPGLAPFVETFASQDIGLVANAPVLLQQLVKSEADWRLVTVGMECFAWRRGRKAEDPTDWRANDPSGSEFRPAPVSLFPNKAATLIQDGLGLSFSVQDWVETSGEFSFLEVNPQGQWLFLDGANEIICDTFAGHLTGTRG
jgi:hypothetical protein